MASRDHLTLIEDLRESLTDQQRVLLNEIWAHFRNHRTWVSTRFLHRGHGASEVRKTLRPLGGSIVVESERSGNEVSHYRLPLLGILVSDKSVERLLTRYLEYVRDRFLEDPTIEQVQGLKVAAALDLQEEEAELLLKLIQIGFFYGGGSGGKGADWQCGVPTDIDELPELEDISEHIRHMATEHYDPAMPVKATEQIAYQSQFPLADTEESELEFVQDPELRDILEQDLAELRTVYDASACKSCLILAGGLLEGILADTLRADPQAARSAIPEQLGNPTKDASSWDLNQLVTVAVHLGILKRTSGHLGHALREYRNLIHPGRQARLGIVITEQDAELAVSILESCIADLNEWHQARKGPTTDGRQQSSGS